MVPRAGCEKERVQTTTSNNDAARETGKNHALKYFSAGKIFAHAGHKYCFILTRQGWRNIGMVADEQRGFYGRHYIQTRKNDKLPVSSVAFVPFCWTGSPSVMSDNDITKNAVEVIGSADII